MEDEIPRPRPRRVNANTHPGKIVNDLKQKRRTTAKKKRKKPQKPRKVDKAEVAQVAEVKDALRREDRAYPNIVSEGDTDSDTHKLRASDDKSEVDHPEAEVPEDTASKQNHREDPEGHKIVVRESDDDDSDDEYQNDPNEEDPDTDKEESEGSDSGLEELEEEIVARKMERRERKNAKEALIKEKKSANSGKIWLREEITQVRKTSAVSGQRESLGLSQSRTAATKVKMKRSVLNGRRKNQETKGDTAPARGFADGLAEAHRPLRLREQILKKTASLKDPTLIPTQPRTPTISDANDDLSNQDRPLGHRMVTHAKHERWAGWRCTRSLAVRDFDDDEDPRSLQAARAARRQRLCPHYVSRNWQFNTKLGRGHPRVIPAIAPHLCNATAERLYFAGGPSGEEKGHQYCRPHEDPSLSPRATNCQNLTGSSRPPISQSQENENAQWDRIVRGVLDWAGTLPDTFGTNEHPDLLDTVQALWDKCLPERTKMCASTLPSRKCTSARRRSRSSTTLSSNDATLRRDSAEVATFVRGLLPYPNERPASKGSWLAPLLLQVFAVHLRQVTKAPTNFGFPAGALALSTAA
ncbi:hypothetical protein EDB85DRAFT_1900711, partial [Lactarius pseudohatsudake]